jgi:uncharacterized repeat protein (TIGR03943 family)
VSDRRTQGALLLAVGASALWLGVSQAALAYVRAVLRLPLAASGLVLLGLAALTLWPGRDGQEPADHGHAHQGPAPRSAWLLAVPVLVLLLVSPPALGSYAASRQGPRAGGGATDAFPALPDAVGGAVPLPVSEFVSRALYDQHRSLTGARVRLVGFVTPAGHGRQGDYLLARFNFFCCAADAEVYELVVRGDPTPRKADQWLLVEGRWLPQPLAKGVASASMRPLLQVDSVTQVRPPPDRYEHNLYAL